MEKQNEHQEVLDLFEVDPDVEDAVELIEEDAVAGGEPPAGLEDMLYEEWRDRQFEAELEVREKTRKVTENGAD